MELQIPVNNETGSQCVVRTPARATWPLPPEQTNTVEAGLFLIFFSQYKTFISSCFNLARVLHGDKVVVPVARSLQGTSPLARPNPPRSVEPYQAPLSGVDRVISINPHSRVSSSRVGQ